MSTVPQPDPPTAENKIKTKNNFIEIFRNQKEFFNTHKTKDLNFRIQQLKRLKEALKAHENKIADAMFADLKRSRPMTYYSEVGLSLKTISVTLNNLKKWAKPKSIKASHDLYPLSKCWIQYEPFGQVLLISPWNYPITLTMGPLIAAMSAGNTAILKPSEISSHASQAMSDMIGEYFDEEYITVCQGDASVAQQLLDLPFDHIMYTGGTQVGKIVMEAAAKHLTPVTLELGGKSPTIVDHTLDLPKTAKRIAMAKFINCGQTCIAPDYVFVHEKIATEFIGELKKWIVKFFTKDTHNSADYGKIINVRHFNRIRNYLKDGNIIFGGGMKEEDLFIEPTLMTDISFESPIMQEEIFGPLLPILTYSNLDDVLEYIRSRPKPLALYIYSNRKEIQKKVLAETSSGGVAINDSITQFISLHLPFGGVGSSGMGRYHGKFGFETFSHHKAVLKQTNLIDLKIKYPPVTEKSIKMLKMILK
jgi:acyl-CoA reductase-like NAD-dependent aldehyde dehydrogenase